ncbi:MAG: hypothetical protein IKV25_07900 [Clostridia bacterium]|nr:hypothetical protein [Clostridia bacterium]
MKKILAIVFTLVLIFSCFAISSFAFESADSFVYEDKAYFDSQPVMTFSEDFKKLYVNDEPFSRADLSILSEYFGYSVDVVKEQSSWLRNSVYVDFTDAQKEMVKGIEISTNKAQNMFLIDMNLGDGSNLSIYFIKDTYLEDYNNVVNGNGEQYVIDFLYPENNVVLTSKSALEGEALTINQEDFFSTYEYFYVDAANKDLSVSRTTGVIFNLNGTYFYFDYIAEGIEDADFLYSGNYVEGQEINVYKITDEQLLMDIELAMESYYGDDYGIFFDKETSDLIALISLIIILVVIPAIVFVVFIIKAIHSKGTYKKLYATVAGLCIAEIIVFIILASIIYPTASKQDESIIGGSVEGEVVIDIGYSDEINEWYEL